MEGQSTNSNSSTGNISSSLGSLSNSTLVELDARDTTVPSSREAHQLSSDASTSFRQMLDNNHDTNFDLNVPYVPPISNLDFLDGISDRSPSPLPQCCDNFGQKRKAPGGSSVDIEGYRDDILHDDSSRSIYPDGPSMSQGPSTWRGVTSGASNYRVSGHPEHSYRNLLPGESPETVRRNLSPSDDRPLSATLFTHWSARTSVNMEGEVTHSIQAERRTLISSQLVNQDQIPKASNQVAGMTQNTGTTSSGYITLFGNVIGPLNRPHHNRNIGSGEASGEYITLFGNVIRPPNGIGCIAMDIGSVNESHIGFTYNTTDINHNIFVQDSWGNFYSREFIAQTSRASNAPVPLPHAQLAAFSSRAAHPDDAVESIHPPMAGDMHGHPTGHAENQDEAPNIDDAEQELDMILELLSDEEIEDLLNELLVNKPLSRTKILKGLNPRKYQSTGRNDGGEQENCSICLDELGAGQDLVKLDCGHSYHFECIQQWLAEKNCCALCKRLAIRLDRD